MKIGILVNDISTEWADYTTTHLAIAATNLGHEVWYMGVGDLALDADDSCNARASAVASKQYRSGNTYLEALNSKHTHHERIALNSLDVLLLRNDPADDVNTRPWARLVGINFGRLAVREGVIVLNDPDGLSLAINKMYLQTFPQEVRPKALITRDREEIKSFIEEQDGWGILKPLAGSGGRNVFLLRPDAGPNLNQMIEAVATEGYIIVEEYLAAAQQGDTRMFLMNGKPLQHKGHFAAFQRVRRAGDRDMRSNMSAGAVAQKAVVTEEMLQLAEQVRPRLEQDGMFLVGLDIVGNKLLEINVFSPGGLFGLERLEGVNFCREVIHALEHKVALAREGGRQFTNREVATLE
jgi:glutathione synthase